MTYILIALIAYLIGNIPGSYMVSMLAYAEDIRTKGSGNAGTTNMLRTYGWLPAIITLVIDFFKGYLAVFIAGKFNEVYGIYLAGVMVVVGHCWPIVLGFKGGKGMATTGGVMLYHLPLFLSVALILFFIINFIGKIMSLTSLILMVVGTLYIIIFHGHNIPLMIMTIILAIIVVYSHRSNIQRLKEGKENKITIKRR